MFETSLLDYRQNGKTNKPFAVFLSLLLQSIAVGIMTVMPLMYAEAVPKIHLMKFLMTPPPPAVAQSPKTAPRIRMMLKPGQVLQRMVEPQVIPEHALILKDDPVPPGPLSSTIGVPGAISDTARGEFSGIIIPVAPPPPPPPTTAPQEPMRVGGQVAAAKLISQPNPCIPRWPSRPASRERFGWRPSSVRKALLGTWRLLPAIHC